MTVDPGLLAVLVSAILGGGGIASLIAFRKASPEIESLSVATLRGVIDEMRAELERKDRTIAELNSRLGAQADRIGQLAARVQKLEMGNPPPHPA